MGKVNYQPKPLFTERMQELLGKDYESYTEILKKYPVKSIRCNKLKMTPDHLKKRLEGKGWKIKQPFEGYPEIMIVESPLLPGELGKAIEHLLGYYYIQELASMLPIIALDPKEDETILDLCAAPGSKTTQLASEMNNTGTIIANDASLGRIRILASNLERCGVANTIIVKRDGFILSRRLKKFDFLFDKILIDAPCSGEGTLRSTPKTYQMWNIKNVFNLSKIQRGLLGTCFDLLKVGGEIVYSTCTHAPEENEEVVDYFLKEFKDRVEIQKIKLPIIPRPGITKWKDKEYLEDVKYSCRVYPQDNNTEGFFIAKFKKLK